MARALAMGVGQSERGARVECSRAQRLAVRYLRRMEFLIVSPELNLPRESYSFDLDYPEDEDDHEVTFSGTKLTTVGSARGQLVKLIRSLIQFSNTLEEVPNERIINMKVSPVGAAVYAQLALAWCVASRGKTPVVECV